MNYDDILSIKDFIIEKEIVQDLLVEPYDFEINDSEGNAITESVIVINGIIPIPIEAISKIYKGDNNILINDEDGKKLGEIILCKDEKFINVGEFNDLQCIAFLNEVKDREIINKIKDGILPNYKFKNNYLFLDEDNYKEYRENYYSSTALWGKFLHENSLIESNYLDLTNIIAYKNIKLPTKYHRESLNRSILEPFAFERYLKLYHLLELLFDHEVVKDIHQLNLEDLKGVAQILNNYKQNDFDRLKHIIFKKCFSGTDRIIECLKNVSCHKDKGKEIFHDFGKKDTNPLFGDSPEKALEKYNNLIDANFDRLIYNKSMKLEDYNKLILKLATYWIYRVRCCIAHNKIGEYVMVHDDEKFIVEFAEPLLQEIIVQAFKVEI